MPARKTSCNEVSAGKRKPRLAGLKSSLDREVTPEAGGYVGDYLRVRARPPPNIGGIPYLASRFVRPCSIEVLVQGSTFAPRRRRQGRSAA